MCERPNARTRSAATVCDPQVALDLRPFHPPALHDLAGLPPDAYPILHEWQIIGEAGWRWLHARRVANHCLRIQNELFARGLSVRKRASRCPVWCVELQESFESASAAARFVGRAPSNILRAIRSGRKCAGYHWERCGYENRSPAKHEH